MTRLPWTGVFAAALASVAASCGGGQEAAAPRPPASSASTLQQAVEAGRDEAETIADGLAKASFADSDAMSESAERLRRHAREIERNPGRSEMYDAVKRLESIWEVESALDELRGRGVEIPRLGD